MESNKGMTIDEIKLKIRTDDENYKNERPQKIRQFCDNILRKIASELENSLRLNHKKFYWHSESRFGYTLEENFSKQERLEINQILVSSCIQLYGPSSKFRIKKRWYYCLLSDFPPTNILMELKFDIV